VGAVVFNAGPDHQGEPGDHHGEDN
jgi:hypothetical protein